MGESISPARQIAYDVLLAVDRGGYASDLLLARSVGLDSRDAGLAAEIVFGALRFQLQLDFLIEHYSGRAAKLDSEVRIALRMGIYQLRYLDRVPAHAAVGESVELIKRARKRSATGFANAILRKVNRQPVAWPSRRRTFAPGVDADAVGRAVRRGVRHGHRARQSAAAGDVHPLAARRARRSAGH